jgi:hypothetical protein
MSPAPKKSTKSTAKGGAKKSGTAATKTPVNPDAMSQDVIEFITAVDDYKRLNQRPFPSWSEILDIVKALGYDREK